MKEGHRSRVPRREYVTAILLAGVGHLDALEFRHCFSVMKFFVHWHLTDTLDWGQDRYGDNGEEGKKDDDDNGSSCALSPHVCQALY